MEQRSEGWHGQRKGRITGSIVGAFLGHSPYMTKAQAVRSMVRSYHGAPSEFVGGPHIDWGVNNEDGAIWQFEMETGLTVEKCGFFTYEDFAGASPDGLIGDDAIFECKAPYSKRNGGEFKSIDDQLHYYDQLQMEMLATGRNLAYFYQWAPHSTKLEMVEYSQSWYDNYMPVIRQAYAEYLSELDNPEHLEPLRRELNTLEAKRVLEEIDQLREAEEQAKERRKELEADLVLMAGSQNANVWGRKLTLIERKGNVQYAKVPELKGVDLEPYRAKSSEYWKLT
jgi:putative phage-type endonuclease